MKRYFRSDLACESGEDLKHIEGTEYERSEGELATLERLRIYTPEAAERLGRPMGTFTTLFCERIWLLSSDSLSLLAGEIALRLRELLMSLTGKKTDRELSVMIVGLGNTQITADALGPRVTELLTVTRHIKEYDEELYDELGMCSISSFCPSVLGKTGIESAELVRAAVDRTKPDVVIAVDALAAGSVERLATTVQLTDTGIDPGAGIGNLRSELSKRSLGVPVIALGIPTVVDSSTLICDALTQAGLSNVPTELYEHLENSRGYYVTPKETDMITENAAHLLAEAIAEALVI